MREIDPATGLPVAPEGHFWEVKMKYGSPYMFLMKEVPTSFLWWKWTYSSEVQDKYMVDGLSERSMIKAATNILKTLDEQESNAHLLGKYPPNSIDKGTNGKA